MAKHAMFLLGFLLTGSAVAGESSTSEAVPSCNELANGLVEQAGVLIRNAQDHPLNDGELDIVFQAAAILGAEAILLRRGQSRLECKSP